jgi:hypothetical protein
VVKKNSAFSSENLLVSIAGHLGIIAVMITSFTVLNPMDQIVMSDHVQIYEIDLSRVEIKGDETLVFNTEAPESKTDEIQIEHKKDPKKQNIIEPIGDDGPILDKISALPDSIKKTDTKPTPNAPKASTTVRVNRETTSLNRTMTISVVDALRVAMTRCWVFNKNYPGIENIRAVVHLSMNPRGFVQSLWFEQESAAANNPALAYIFETIRAAITNCQPFKMLPENEYEKWKTIQLTFYPSNASVQ